jgi:hypothetical protein
VSDAAGGNWSGPVEVVPGGFAYSQLSMIRPGEVGLLFEGAGYARIGLLRLDLAEVLADAATASRASRTPVSVP